jgi:hypothetical protein
MDASVASRPKRGPDFLPAIPLIAKHSVRFTVVAASWFAAHEEASPSKPQLRLRGLLFVRSLRMRCLTDSPTERIRPRVDHYKGLDEPATSKRLDRWSQSQRDCDVGQASRPERDPEGAPALGTLARASRSVQPN